MHDTTEVRSAGRPPTVIQTRRVVLNWPVELYERLKVLAAQERRPLNTQIQVLVERALEQEAAAA